MFTIAVGDDDFPDVNDEDYTDDDNDADLGRGEHSYTDDFDKDYHDPHDVENDTDDGDA